MTHDAWKLPASFCVQRFSRRCLEHPSLESDPACVIATERERMIAEIEQAEMPEPVVVSVKETCCNGKARKRRVG